MKKEKIIFWTATIIIFLAEGLMPLLTFQSEMAKEGIRHLGYPVYFGNTLVVFKVLGSLALIIPQVPKRLKEWTYAGFAFDFVFAGISIVSVDGINGQIIVPMAAMALLIVSYIYYHKLNTDKI